MRIETTSNYNKFKFLHFNRDLEESVINKLIKLNEDENDFPYYPIVVNNHMEIIDGQHRFEACKKTEQPIYYIIKPDNDTTVADVNRVNIAGKKHTLSTKLEMLGKAGNEVICALIDLRKELGDIYSLSVFFSFSIKSVCSGSTTLNVLENGTLDLCDIELTRECLGALIKTRIIGCETERVLYTILSIAKRNKMGFLEVLKLLEEKHYMIEGRPSRTTTRIHFVGVLNYNKRKNKFK